MPRCTVELNQELYDALVEIAVRKRCQIPMHAEVLLREEIRHAWDALTTAAARAAALHQEPVDADYDLDHP